MTDLIFVFTTVFENDITYDVKYKKLHIVKNFDLFKYPSNLRKLFYKYFASLDFAEENFTKKDLIACMRKDEYLKYIPNSLITSVFITSYSPHKKLLEEDYVFLNECSTLNDRMHHLPPHVVVYDTSALDASVLDANANANAVSANTQDTFVNYIYYLQNNLISLNKQILDACNSEVIEYFDDETMIKILHDEELFKASDKTQLIKRLYDNDTNLTKIHNIHTHSISMVKFIISTTHRIPFNVPFCNELLETLTYVDVLQDDFVKWFDTITKEQLTILLNDAVCESKETAQLPTPNELIMAVSNDTMFNVRIHSIGIASNAVSYFGKMSYNDKRRLGHLFYAKGWMSLANSLIPPLVLELLKRVFEDNAPKEKSASSQDVNSNIVYNSTNCINKVMCKQYKNVPYKSYTLLLCADASNIKLFDLTIPELFIYVATHFVKEHTISFLNSLKNNEPLRCERIWKWIVDNIDDNAMLLNVLNANDGNVEILDAIYAKHPTFGEYWFESEIRLKCITSDNFKELFDKYVKEHFTPTFQTLGFAWIAAYHEEPPIEIYGAPNLNVCNNTNAKIWRECVNASTIPMEMTNMSYYDFMIKNAGEKLNPNECVMWSFFSNSLENKIIFCKADVEFNMPAIKRYHIPIEYAKVKPFLHEELLTNDICMFSKVKDDDWAKISGGKVDIDCVVFSDMKNIYRERTPLKDVIKYLISMISIKFDVNCVDECT